VTSPITPDPSIHHVPAKIQNTQTGTPLPTEMLYAWGQNLLNAIVSQIVSALTFGLVKPSQVNGALVGLENWWQGILDGFAISLGLKPGTGSGTGETGTPSSGSGTGAAVPGKPTVQDVFTKLDLLRGDATEAGTGLIPGHRIPVIPVSHLGADSPNLLIGGGFDDEKNLDPTGSFTWNGTYGRTKPGCAQVIPDGTDHVLYSNPIDVLSEQTFEVGGYVRWLLIAATAGEPAIQVSVAAYAGSTLKSTTPIYTVVNPVAMTDLTTWRELAGTWTYNSAVDPTVDNIRLKLLVSHNVTSTYAGYGYVWWDDLAAYKLGILKGHLVTGLTSGGTETTIVDDLQGTLDHAVDGYNQTYGTTGTTLTGFRGVHSGHKYDSWAAQSTANTGVSNASAAQGTANTASSNVTSTWNYAVDGYYNTSGTTGKTLIDFKNTHRGHKTDSEGAQSTANTGVSNASTAQGTANTANSNATSTWNYAVDGYYNTSGTTGKTLIDFKNTHRGHKTDSEGAQSTANTGVSNASTAQGTANAAASAASDASKAAGDATTAASNASKAAGDATTAANGANTKTVNLQTSIIAGYTVSTLYSSQYFTIPSNLSEFYVICFGAGANGSQPFNSGTGGVGGAAGAVIATQLDAVTLPAAGTSVLCTIGSSSSPTSSFGTIVSTADAYKGYVSTPLGLHATVNLPSAGGNGGNSGASASAGSAGAATNAGLAGGSGGAALDTTGAGIAGTGGSGGSGITIGLSRTGGSGGGGGGGARTTGSSSVVTGGTGGAGGFPGGGGGGGGTALNSAKAANIVYGSGGAGGNGMITVIYKLAKTTT